MYAISVNILGAYLTIKFNEELFSNIGNLLLPLLALETFVVIMGLGTTAGFVNKASKKTTAKLKVGMYDVVRQNGKDMTCLRRTINACCPMKIRFGSNFVDILAPLVITCFCKRTLVRLLLCF